MVLSSMEHFMRFSLNLHKNSHLFLFDYNPNC